MSDESSDSFVHVHVDKKPCIRSKTTLADVPEEILIRIFANVDAIEVARLQLVSSQWNRIIRSTPCVWRNALYLDMGLDEPTLPALSFRLCKLANLSDRKLDKVGLCFYPCTPCCHCCSGGASRYAENMSRWVFESLRGISIRVLYVFLEEFAWEEGRDDYRDAVYSSLEKLSHSDFESLIICFRRTDEEDSDDDEDVRPCLLDAVGFSDDVRHRLYLDRVTFSGGVQPSSKIFSNLTGLFLESVRFDGEEDIRALWTVLEALQDKLHELFLNLCHNALPFAKKLGIERETIVQLNFTKLVRFHLGYSKSHPFQRGDVGPQVYGFSCPVLESLSLNCRAPYALFDGLMTSTVKNVRVTCETLAREENVKALMKCPDLQKLFIDGRSTFDSDDRHRIIVSALRIAPQEMIIVVDHGPPKTHLLSFVELAESIFPFHAKSPKVGFCNVIRDRKSRELHLDALRQAVPNAEQYSWMENARPYFAMHEHTWGNYDVRAEL